MKRELKMLNLESRIQYTPVTKMYGRAEFVFCPVYSRGKMRKLYIYRKQQIGMNFEYCLDLKDYNVKSFSITSWIHRTDLPNTWRESWCKEHKTIAHEVYVPDDTNCLEFDYSLGNWLTIRFVEHEFI